MSGFHFRNPGFTGNLIPPISFNFDQMAFFGGGLVGGGAGNANLRSYVRVYNKDFVLTEATALDTVRFIHNVERTPNHVIYLGGYYNFNGQTNVNAYNKDLVKATNPSPITWGSAYDAAGHNELYAVIGSRFSNNSGTNNNWDTYNVNLVKASAAGRGGQVRGWAGVKDKFVNLGENSNLVSYFTSNMTRTDSTLPFNTTPMKSNAHLKDYGLVMSVTGDFKRVFAFNENLVRSDLAVPFQDNSGAYQVGQFYRDYAFIPNHSIQFNNNTVAWYNNENLVMSTANIGESTIIQQAVASAGDSILVYGGNVSTTNGYGTKTAMVQRYQFNGTGFTRAANLPNASEAITHIIGQSIS